MIVFVALLVIVVISTAECAPAGSFNREYLSRDNTTVIKGVFVALILLSHGKDYINLSGVLDQPYLQFQNHLNQMVVSMFFFYSGYGMMEAIKKKRFSYVKSIATKRFPSVYLNFALALFCFMIRNAAMGIHFSVKDILLAFTGYGTIGNSNWYMFAIFGLYILNFIAFLPMKLYKNPRADIICISLLTALSCVFVLLQIIYKRPWYCYDTIILYPLGYWYSYFKNPIEKLCMKNNILYFGIVTGTLGLYILSFRHRWQYGIEGYTVWAACFVALVILFTMKVTVRSRFMHFLGDHVFSIYILQRIPFAVFSGLGVAATNKYAFFILSTAATFFLVTAFDYFTGKLQKRLFR